MTTTFKERLNTQNHPVKYDRSQLITSQVHLGFGAFHRAHQALLTDQLVAEHGARWGICEVNLLGGEQLIKQLRLQDHRYSVLEKGANSSELKIIDVITNSLHLELDGAEAILQQMSAPAIKIVSMTITEKGYCLDPSTGHLDKQNPMIANDIQHPQSPRSALGFIVEALNRRHQQSLKPFSVMSCDNIQGNGHLVKKAVLELACLQNSTLAEWIETNVSFPCTMVDRIVPAATEASLNEVASYLKCEDPCAIACEPFIQWVIEDNFVNDRPDWDRVGAQFVSDVIPYEEMKLRMLNGSHSFLAYLGYLAGYQTIDATVADPHFAKAARSLMLDEQAQTLNMPEGTDIKAYADLLLERFSNPNLKHRTWQIAMDGSQKLPQRFLKPLSILLKQGKDYRHLALAIAGWMVYVGGVDEQGQTIDVQDPLAEQLKSICDKAGDNRVTALLDVSQIFAPELASNSDFVATLQTSYQKLIAHGSKQAVIELHPSL